MLSVIIPVLNPGPRLALVFESLQKELGELLSEVIVVNAGMDDAAERACVDASATIIQSEKGRGRQLAVGGDEAKGPWLLFLHADSVLTSGCGSQAAVFMVDPANDGRAACFNLAYDDDTPGIRRVARLASWRSQTFGLPYGDQGLLITKKHYTQIGGYADMALMEDVDLVRRIGRRNLVHLDSALETSAEKYRRGGTLLRPLRNLFCLFLYFCRVPIRYIARLYG